LLFAPRRKYSLLSYFGPWLNLKVMGLSKEAIKEFKRIYRKEFKEETSELKLKS